MPFALEDLDSNFSMLVSLRLQPSQLTDLREHVRRLRHGGEKRKPELQRCGKSRSVASPSKSYASLIDAAVRRSSAPQLDLLSSGGL